METLTQLSKKPFIILDDVTLSLNEQNLFEHTHWRWEVGQHWAIIGPNGSGKSVLAHALCRKMAVFSDQIHYFFEPDSQNSGSPFFTRGEVIMISPEGHQDLLRQCGSYHQARWQSFEGDDVPLVSDFLSGKSIEHISPFEVTPLKTNEERYLTRRQNAIKLLRIEYLLDRKIHQLSNGESRKVLIARALMQSPKLLILDDPFTGLDSSSRELLQHVIEQLLTIGGPQILLVTARLEEIFQGITHLLCVANNQVIDQGPKDIILSKEFMRQNLATREEPLNTLPLQFPDFQQDYITNNAPLIEMKHTSIAYNGVHVLSDINWTMQQGECWAVLGHNGAGKSTLLSLILADNPQSYANDIQLFGKPRGSGESIWEIKKRIGWVAPELQIYYSNSGSCFEVVCSGFFDSIGLYQDCSLEQTATVNDWMRLFKIDKLADQLFHTLSLGEQRLTLLARALVKKPVLLILDEPCQGLDLHHRIYINELLDQLCEQTPVSIIYVTHYYDEMPQAITHVLKLQNGQVIENGPK
jgi:molybdate transport system ATP-binding protein